MLQLPPMKLERSPTESTVACAEFFRYPEVRLNQINWPAELYANAALLTGDPELLRRDYRQHLRRFVKGVRHPLTKGGTTNLGRGYQLHYLPHYPVADPSNLDSAEYGNMTLHALTRTTRRSKAGMAPLPREDIAAAAALGRARPVRLLDPRGMHQLGHRAGASSAG